MVSTVGWVVIVIVAVIVLYLIYLYNSLIRLKIRVDNAWSQIDVQLKRRYDLIPNLVNTVKGYMKHERTVLENITKMRAALIKGPMASRAKADNVITEALKTIFAVAENYPNLKASENFKMLQEELAGTESKIAYARQFYNDSVQDLNIRINVWPSSLMANTMRLKEKEFFKTAEKERGPIKVEF